MATETAQMLSSSTDDITTDIVDVITGGLPYCDTSGSDATIWIILFIISTTALLISCVINIILCCRIRGKELKVSKILLLCKRRNYDIERNEYSAVPTKVPVGKTMGKQPESDYEMPMSINAKIARSFTFPRTAMEAEMKSCNDSNALKVPETDSTEKEIPSGSVKAKRRIFESGDKNANLSSSTSSLNVVKSNLEVCLSSSKASSLDVADSQTDGGDSAPEDMAPAPYEMVHFRKKSRKGKKDLNKKPQTDRSSDKVHSTVIIQKDGTMEIKVADSDDDGEERRESLPENEPPPLLYDRISYPTRKKKRQCRVM